LKAYSHAAVWDGTREYTQNVKVFSSVNPAGRANAAMMAQLSNNRGI
jgi:hypothetical protein